MLVYDLVIIIFMGGSYRCLTLTVYIS